jgi:divalent metal cation (Fe/Co/Zn/Cd) transporter
VIVWIVPGWHLLDPVMAIAVALHIIYTGVDLLRRSADGLMDVSLPAEDILNLEQIIRAELPKEASYQGLRTRKAGARRFIEFNLLLPGEASVAVAHELCDRIEAKLRACWSNLSVTIHVEPH